MEINEQNKIVKRERKIQASSESEQNCIGLCLKVRDCITDATEKITSNDFYWHENKLIFESIVDLYNKNLHVDTVTVIDELRKKGLLEAAKGRTYIDNLFDLAINEKEINNYVARIKDWSAIREIAKNNEENLSKIYSGEIKDPSQLIDAQFSELTKISNRVTKGSVHSMKDLESVTLEKIEKAFKLKKSVTGITTGFLAIDKLTGGFQPHQYIVIAARQGCGKSGLALQLGMHISSYERLPVIYFSPEMAKEQLINRALAIHSEVKAQKIQNGTMQNNEFQDVKDSLKFLSDVPLLFDDTPDCTVSEIKSKSLKILNKYGCLGAVIVDYIKLLKSSHRSNSSFEQVAEISLELKNMARELPCPVIVLAQMNRNVESRQDKTPILSDLADTDQIGRDADIVTFLHRPAYYAKKKTFGGNSNQANGPRSQFNNNNSEYDANDENKAYLIFEKHRNGPNGTIMLNYEADITKFRECR